MKTRLNRIAKDTNLFLKKFLNNQNNSKLILAMKYGLFPGGKKIRSKVLIDIGSLLSIDYKTLIAIGAAKGNLSFLNKFLKTGCFGNLTAKVPLLLFIIFEILEFFFNFKI